MQVSNDAHNRLITGRKTWLAHLPNARSGARQAARPAPVMVKMDDLMSL